MPFRFYCILTLLFVVMLVWSRRDFGPMLQAELNAQKEDTEQSADEVSATQTQYARPIDGVLPILVTLIGIVWAFLYFAQESWDAASDQMLNILPICGVTGGVFGLVWTHFRTGLKFPEALKAYLMGIRTVAPTLAILVLAMTIQGLTDQLGTGVYLAGLVHDAPPILLPAAVFLLSGAVAFCTGSSWATMGLLVPVAVPIAHAMVETHNMTPALTLAVAGSVLDGAIFGDHCSPISDTTVMSSAASGCPHLSHVRTQVPYALTVMLVAAVVGYGFSTLVLGSPWPAYGLGTVVLFGIIRVFGKPSDLS
jgi:Na+/H+ antiporter NhaC